jgi:hypothetical protein
MPHLHLPSHVRGVNGLTSEIPFLCIRRYRVVHEILRGFLRWRNRDSVLLFWKRKILLSPRMYSLPCGVRQRLSPMAQRQCPSARRCVWRATAGAGHVAGPRGDGKTHLARVDLLAAEGVFVGTHVGGVGSTCCVSRGVVVGGRLKVEFWIVCEASPR